MKVNDEWNAVRGSADRQVHVSPKRDPVLIPAIHSEVSNASPRSDSLSQLSKVSIHHNYLLLLVQVSIQHGQREQHECPRNRENTIVHYLW